MVLATQHLQAPSPACWGNTQHEVLSGRRTPDSSFNMWFPVGGYPETMERERAAGGRGKRRQDGEND